MRKTRGEDGCHVEETDRITNMIRMLVKRKAHTTSDWLMYKLGPCRCFSVSLSRSDRAGSDLLGAAGLRRGEGIRKHVESSGMLLPVRILRLTVMQIRLSRNTKEMAGKGSMDCVATQTSK